MISGETWTADVDALAIRRGDGPFTRVDRRAVAFPPTAYNRIGTAFSSLCGTLVRIEIEQRPARCALPRHTVAQVRPALVPEIVIGQSQGGFAMGVGYALLETLPPFEDGPGNGQWNLGQYVVRADPICRCMISRSKSCPRSPATSPPREWRRS